MRAYAGCVKLMESGGRGQKIGKDAKGQLSLVHVCPELIGKPYQTKTVLGHVLGDRFRFVLGSAGSMTTIVQWQPQPFNYS